MKQCKQQNSDEKFALAAVHRGMNRWVKEISAKNKYLKILCSILCTVLILSGVSFGLNTHPAVAAQLEDIPVIGWIVRVLTLEHIVERSKTLDADITIPRLDGMKNLELQEIVNREIQADADELLSSARESAKELEKMHSGIPVTVHSDYTVHHTKDILSFGIVVTHIGASAAETMKQYNIDLKTEKRLTLKDFFIDSSNYKERIDHIIVEKIQQNQEYYFELGKESAFHGINEDTQFFIGKDGQLIIIFDEYQIAPGSTGMPQFEIPKTEIVSILKPEYREIIC